MSWRGRRCCRCRSTSCSQTQSLQTQVWCWCWHTMKEVAFGVSQGMTAVYCSPSPQLPHKRHDELPLQICTPDNQLQEPHPKACALRNSMAADDQVQTFPDLCSRWSLTATSISNAGTAAITWWHFERGGPLCVAACPGHQQELH